LVPATDFSKPLSEIGPHFSVLLSGAQAENGEEITGLPAATCTMRLSVIEPPRGGTESITWPLRKHSQRPCLRTALVPHLIHPLPQVSFMRKSWKKGDSFGKLGSSVSASSGGKLWRQKNESV
jgi:hypothetical protein